MFGIQLLLSNKSDGLAIMEFYEYLKQGFEVGYVFSVAFLTATFTSYYFFTWLHFTTTHNKPPFRRSEPRSPPHHQVLETERWVARMKSEEIKKATNDFSNNNLIGVGEMGAMFKAVLPNGVSVAVKRVNILRSEKHLISELKCVGRLRHRNLVPLIGFCADDGEQKALLVYKYMPNGNLRDWLRTRKREESVAGADKEWSLRLRIGVGVARALAWLHHCSAFRLAHLNLTSRCVLLDYHFVPCVSNFSGAVFAELPRSSRRRRWEMEYLKRDVYSFGILLVEIFTPKEQARIASCSVAAGRLREHVRSHGHHYRDDVLMALKVALECVGPVADHRPTMVQVYESLVQIQAGNQYVK